MAKEGSVRSSKWQNQTPLVTISCNTEKHAQASQREVKSMLVFAAGEIGEASAAFPHASKSGAGEALFLLAHAGAKHDVTDGEPSHRDRTPFPQTSRKQGGEHLPTFLQAWDFHREARGRNVTGGQDPVSQLLQFLIFHTERLDGEPAIPTGDPGHIHRCL